MTNKRTVFEHWAIVTAISGIRSLNGVAGDAAFVAGVTPNGAFRFDPTDTTSADNGTTIIVATDNGRWKLISIDGGALPTIPNNTALQWLDSAGVARQVVVLNASNDVYVGDITNALTGRALFLSAQALVGVNVNAAHVASFTATALSLGSTLPSAWIGMTALQGSGDLAVASPSSMHAVSNAYSVSGVWKYIAAAAASRVTTSLGVTTFYSAVSGAANANVTWVQTGQLDAAGNFAITGQLTAAGTITDTQSESLRAVRDTGLITFYNTLNTVRTGYLSGVSGTGMTLVADTGSITFNANGAVRLTISSAGVVSDATAELGWKDIPVNAKAAAYTLVLADRGKQILTTTGGVTVPNSIFSAGNIVTIVNNSATAQTITQGTGVTLHQAGTTNTGNRTLAAWGIATVLCIGAGAFIVSGNVT